MNNSFMKKYYHHHPVPQKGRINRNWINFLFAHPLFIRASLIMMHRFAVLFNYRIPSQAPTQMWDVYDVVVKKKTRHVLLTRTSMCGLLVCRLIGFRSMNHYRHRHLAQCVVTPFRFIGKTKNEAETFFQEGKRMLSQCRYRATKMFEMATLLMHGESHAVLSSIIYSRCRYYNYLSFKYAVQGERIGCPHSKGALALCYIHGTGVIKDAEKGFTLAQESAKTGSCYGRLALAICYINGKGVAQNYAEAAHLLHLSAAQGYVFAQFELGNLYQHGRGIAQNDAEAVKWYRLAAKQDNFDAKYALSCMSRDGRGGA
jgi:hypothetical protein